MNTPVTIIVIAIMIFVISFYCHRRHHLTHYLIIKIITDLVISIVIDMINHHFSLEKEVSHTPHMYRLVHFLPNFSAISPGSFPVHQCKFEPRPNK